MTTTSRTASPAPSPTDPRLRLRAFHTPVRGHAFAASPPGCTAPAPGTAVRLRREPDNPADPLAVAVWVDGVHGSAWRLGYLDRGVAARIAPRLDAGVEIAAAFEGWLDEPDGRWSRPLVRLLPAADDHAVPAAGARGVWGRPPGVVRRPVG